jgi:hypothetical protein
MTEHHRKLKLTKIQLANLLAGKQIKLSNKALSGGFMFPMLMRQATIYDKAKLEGKGMSLKLTKKHINLLNGQGFSNSGVGKFLDFGKMYAPFLMML